MQGLFSEPEPRPLALRMSPLDLDEFVGQAELCGPGRPLRRLIERDRLLSAVLFGPAGSGKTALARIIARRTDRRFERLNAVTDGVADIRRVISAADRDRKAGGQATILFVDEIHRFNRAQQDALLPSVEDGTIVCIGATTENPLFSVNSPLLSRMRVFQFEPLGRDDILTLLARAIDDPRGLSGAVSVDDEARSEIARLAGGDARVALNVLELSADLAGSDGVTRDLIADCVRHQVFRYDRQGGAHYDHASAFIKSMRGSDPQATVFWLARMLAGGEDPMFVARRIVICAAEDVGLADPMALVVAQAAAGATHMVGMPEARILLAEAALYVSMAPKSNASYRAIEAAWSDALHIPIDGVPVHLRDGGSRGSQLGYGIDYRYPHDYPGAVVDQAYLPRELADRKYYVPTDRGKEGRYERNPPHDCPDTEGQRGPDQPG